MMLLINHETKDFYHDEDTNELYHDNIGLDFKLNGYLSCQNSGLSRTLCSLDAKLLNSNYQPSTDEEEIVKIVAQTINQGDFDVKDTPGDQDLEGPRLNFQVWSEESSHTENDIFSELMNYSLCGNSPSNLQNNIWDIVNESNSKYSTPSSELSDIGQFPMATVKNDGIGDIESVIERYLEENFTGDLGGGTEIRSNGDIPKQHFKNNLKIASRKLYNISVITPKLKEPAFRFKDDSNIGESLLEVFHDKIDIYQRYECNHCQIEVQSLRELILHYEKFNLFKHLKYRCVVNDCPFKMIGFDKKILLRKHLINEHLNDKDPSRNIKDKNEHNLVRQLLFICPKCDKLFSRRDTSQRHEKTVHKPKFKRKRHKSLP